MTDQEYMLLKKKVLTMTGIDLDNYKSQQMRRRLESFIENLYSDVITYCRTIEKDEESLRKLCDFLTINVTEFFRDKWAFDDLEKNVLPGLIANKTRINIWSAGCSNGAEAYSIAMILNSLPRKISFQILGTDMDEISLSRARAGGPYRADLLKNVPPQYFSRYFSRDGDDFWLQKEIRDRVVFKKHNLLSDPFEVGFDLIACRNVTIYFTEEAKDSLNRRFYRSLNENGVLFVGATEFMINALKAGYQKMGTCFYRKAARSTADV
jgi:chemotaxis protein methyltransferase CheR